MAKPPHPPTPRDLELTLNYTFVALIGMLAGFLVGYIFGHRAAGPVGAAVPPVQDLRSLSPIDR